MYQLRNSKNEPENRFYKDKLCFNHGKNNLGEKIKVEMDIVTAFKNEKGTYKNLVCPKCHIQIPIM